VDYASGRIIYTIAPTKSGIHFLEFLKVLLRAYPDRKIRLVCDNGRFHHSAAVRSWLEAHRDQIMVFWLPPFSPSLNLIERLSGHLKRTILANVLFATMQDLITAFRKGIARINRRRDQMGFMFHHEKPRKEVG
jgi:transposase